MVDATVTTRPNPGGTEATVSKVIGQIEANLRVTVPEAVIDRRVAAGKESTMEEGSTLFRRYSDGYIFEAVLRDSELVVNRETVPLKWILTRRPIWCTIGLCVLGRG